MTSLNFIPPKQPSLPLPEKPKTNGQASLCQTVTNSSVNRVRMLVTPEMAKHWLETSNTHNRPLSETHALKIAMDIEEGRWQYLGDPIRFAEDGQLLDGQHRLNAVVLAGKPIDTDVIFGLPKSTLDLIDGGVMVRTPGQIAHLNGIPNANTAAAIAGLLLVHKKHGIERMNNPRLNPTKAQVVAATRTLDGLQPAALQARKKWIRSVVAPRLAGFCYYLFSLQDQGLADKFFDELNSGANLAPNNPAHLLREKLSVVSKSKAKLPAPHVIALFFRAWTNYRSGKTMRLLKTWRTDGSTPEQFPSIGPVPGFRD